MTFPPLILPVLLAAMRPTFLPEEAPRLTVEAFPICRWLPPPWGCSTGFMATPRTFGQLFLFTLYLWKALPALRIGLSILPPPAIHPTMARLAEGITFLHPGLLGVRVVGDHGGIVAGGPGELAAITSLLLKVAHDGSLGHVADGHHVADGKVGLLAAVHELSSVHTLSSDEELLLHLVSVRIPEVGHGKGSATAWVVDDPH